MQITKTLLFTCLLFLGMVLSKTTNAQGFYKIAHAVDSLYPNETIENGQKAKVRRIFKDGMGK